LFYQNEISQGFFWVLKGNCKVTRLVAHNQEQIITLLGPGDFAGITSCLNDSGYTKSCYALDDDTVSLFIPKEDFHAYFMKNPGITLALLRQVESKIDRIENRATQFMRKTIDQRLAHAILMLRDKFGRTAEGFLNMRLSPQEYASLIGSTRTTVYRIFKRFEDEHILEVRNKRIMLLNPDKLYMISEQG
jgi:CRP-like cAMP-binding protein